MHIDTTVAVRNGKQYVRHLLRTSYRENGKVKHRTIANLSSCSDNEIQAIKLALKHKNSLSDLTSLKDVSSTLGKSIGAVWVLKAVAETIGISKVLGDEQAGKLALVQVIARLIDQGSRLSAVRLARSHAICEILGINKLDEDDLYENLAWLCDNQETIEKELFRLRFHDATPTLFLYDVTSAYLEGTCNQLAGWGYNRDKKSGKMQIVIGLLAGPDGLPIAVRVFEGNTNDTRTVSQQVKILANTFGVKHVTLVGDRGMLKGPQIDELPDDFRYITAITKPQIAKMLSEGTLQYELFNDQVCEVCSDGIRYVLRRNPIRAQQIADTRKAKLDTVLKVARERTEYLAEHGKASVDSALKRVVSKINKLKAEKWLSAAVHDRIISVSQDEEAVQEEALLDGCYVIKSDVPHEDADTQTLHDRYCDLENVERCFRTMKTVHLELRPVFVIKESSTKGHVFVVMLALLLQRQLEQYWKELDVTVEEGIKNLSGIHMQEIRLGNESIQNIPNPDRLGKQLLERAQIDLPSVLPSKTANVATKKKLQSERII
jgi:transposase